MAVLPLDWLGVLRVLDAGPTLNYPELLEHPVLADRDVIICDLAHGWRGWRRHSGT